MSKGRSVSWRVGEWHDRKDDEKEVLKRHSGHRVNIKSVYKTELCIRYLDAISLECEDCGEVLLWYQEGDDVHAVVVPDAKRKVAKSAYDADESEYVLDHADAIVTRRGYLRN